MDAIAKTTATLDRMELKIDLTGPHAPYTDKPPNYLIVPSIHINGERLAPGNTISLVVLAKSCQSSGEFFIVTCDCGEAGCAGIDDGIRVTHFGDRIEWEIPDPISYRGMSQEQAVRISENRLYKKYVFQPEAYLSAVQEGLRIAKGLLFGEKQPAECVPDGFYPEQLLSLDPIVFSERGAPLGCQIVATKVFLDGTVDWVRINGIPYRLRDLPIPDDIKALGSWSDWEPKPCGLNGLVFGDLAAPEWELRRRIRLLADYLASITVKSGHVQASYRGWRYQQRRSFDRQLVIYGRSDCGSCAGELRLES